jgi:hypothetical protein
MHAAAGRSGGAVTGEGPPKEGVYRGGAAGRNKVSLNPKPGPEAHRARPRARRAAKCGQFSGASNEPIFDAIGARGAAPRRLQCARDHDE